MAEQPDGLTPSVSDLATGGLPAMPQVPDAAQVRVPAKLGPYRVLGRVGEGGMGVVFRGHDEVLDRPVALKVLGASSADPRLADIVREARAVAAVAHPNVVQIYAAGEQDGLSYFAMELVSGPDLRELLEREGPLAPERARRYMTEAASGLRAASRRGIFHRDVKPGNLLLDRAADVVKVADFGLARQACVDASLAGTSLIAGTPLYVAPEVIKDGSGDERADIYSLGATFFHLLAGRPPFGDANPADVLVGHATRPAPDLRALRADVPERLARTIARALEKDPAARHPSYDDLLADLERTTPTVRLVAHPPVAAPAPVALPAPSPPALALPTAPTPPPAPPARRAPAPPRRQRLLAILLAGVALSAFVRHAHEKNLRRRAEREAQIEAQEAIERFEEEQRWARDRARQHPVLRELAAAEHRLAHLFTKPEAPENARPVLATVPPRARFPLSVEPAFAQVAWIVRNVGLRAFPDELAPVAVDDSWDDVLEEGSARPVERRCAATELPFAIAGPSGSMLVAWHVHDLSRRMVIYVDEDGNELATTILKLLLWLHRRADERGVAWDTVVRRVKPFLPRDVDARELEQIDETY